MGLAKKGLLKKTLILSGHDFLATYKRYSYALSARNCRGNLLRSVPFLMAGHLNIKIFQTLGMPFFNTNPKIWCPKRICQYRGQAPRHFTCRFHYMSCSTDVRPWDSKRKFVFLLQIVPITKTFVLNASKYSKTCLIELEKTALITFTLQQTMSRPFSEISWPDI